MKMGSTALLPNANRFVCELSDFLCDEHGWEFKSFDNTFTRVSLETSVVFYKRILEK
jgi:hypothetical protein